MSCRNQTEIKREYCDLSSENEEKHDTETTSERSHKHFTGEDACFKDQEKIMELIVLKEKEPAVSACEFISSPPEISGSKCHFESLNVLTKDQPEPDLQNSRPTPALTSTDDSTPSQRPSEINKQDLQHKVETWTSHQVVLQLNQRAHEDLLKQRCEESEEVIPAVVVTQPEEVSSVLSLEYQDMVSSNTSLSDGPELISSDVQSLKSDTVSLMSEMTISGKSDEQEGPEEDTQSVTASSVMSLFHRIQMDPIEREWMRCAALGKTSVLYVLLQQDNGLVLRKDFVTTALHWAAKQGRVEMADTMASSGADVNQRTGYTPLHLASLHGHGNIIQLLINNYNAKINIRDYHGKMAAHYWNGSMDIFNTHGSHSAGRWSRGRRSQCYTQLSALLSRSRSHGNISGQMCGSPLTRISQSPSP